MCGSGDQCESELCAAGRCLDPDGDEDGDTLTNSIEFQLGSDPFNADTDSDLVSDPDELEVIANVDTDGDGKAESSRASSSMSTTTACPISSTPTMGPSRAT